MLTVVIPARNCERALVPTLAMLVGAAMSGTVRDVIVAEGGSTDETAEVAEVAGCTVLVSTAPLADRLRSAAASARAQWLLFLRPGTVLDESWAEEAARFVQDAERSGNVEARAAVFHRTPNARRPVLGALAQVASAIGAPRPEQGLVISRRLYERLGGHRAGAAPEADLIGRIGRRRIVTLKSGAKAVANGA
jgi:glycosyltransferase involved in cell wall biosynthesis